MNEDAWLAATDPFALLDVLFPPGGCDGPSNSAATRKSRLYCVACANRLRDGLPWEVQTLVDLGERVVQKIELNADRRRAIREVAERITEGDSRSALSRARRELAALGYKNPAKAAPLVGSEARWREIAHMTYAVHSTHVMPFRHFPVGVHEADVVREIFPPRRFSFSADWRTSDVLAMADRIERTGDFSPTPFLADALQDAGCYLDPLLNHLRDATRKHVRGCWVVDLVLGK